MAHETAPTFDEQSAQEPFGRPYGAFDSSSFQAHLLKGVSRTFALTIPQLPGALRDTVTNAYLLCRIADTIEDDPRLEPAEKDRFHSAFLEAVETGRGDADFARELHPRLAPGTPAAEIELIRECPTVLRVTHGLEPRQRTAILRCVSIMSSGMGEFERSRSNRGLDDVAGLERYCYYVAGVVGEMLTDLFCDYSTEIERNRPLLDATAVSFGLGLQMTNILMDVWDDLEMGVCWLPREVFSRHGYDLGQLDPHHNGDGRAFAGAMQELVEIAHGHLRRALDYTLTIPSGETGIRRFLIWAALLAVSTLRGISTDPLFTERNQVKVSRRKVKMIVALSSATIRSNTGLTTLFNAAARGLPLADRQDQQADESNMSDKAVVSQDDKG